MRARFFAMVVTAVPLLLGCGDDSGDDDDSPRAGAAGAMNRAGAGGASAGAGQGGRAGSNSNPGSAGRAGGSTTAGSGGRSGGSDGGRGGLPSLGGFTFGGNFNLGGFGGLPFDSCDGIEDGDACTEAEVCAGENCFGACNDGEWRLLCF